jgi:hypothetical protein
MKNFVEYKESKEGHVSKKEKTESVNQNINIIRGESNEIYYCVEEDKVESESSFSDCIDIEQNEEFKSNLEQV